MQQHIFALNLLVVSSLLLVSGQAWANPSQSLPAMQLEGQFQGPFQDTVIQRWRDPQNGTLCYLYIPVRVENQRTPTGGYAYGANSLGAMSCIAAPSANNSPKASR